MDLAVEERCSPSGDDGDDSGAGSAMDARDAGLGADGVAEARVSRWIVMVAGLSVALGLGSGCGESCNTACFKAYDERECNVDTPGQMADARIRECIADCRSALRRVGPMGDYSPFGSGGLERVQLQNERQAAAWMDCIGESECSELQAGRCNPL